MWPLEPVAYVEASRQQARDDFWGQTLACIRLSEALMQAYWLPEEA